MLFSLFFIDVLRNLFLFYCYQVLGTMNNEAHRIQDEGEDVLPFSPITGIISIYLLIILLIYFYFFNHDLFLNH